MSAKTALRVASTIVVAALWAVIGGQTASAQNVYTWTDAGTDWNTAANWSGSTLAVPGSGDIAEFVNTTTYNNPPNAGVGGPVGGLWVTGAAPLTINKNIGNALTLYGATINGNAATGIEMDPGAGAVNVTPNLVLAVPQTWLNNSSNLLTVSSAVNNGGNNLTLAGAGNVAINGVISGGGALIENGSGVVTVNAGCTYAGGTTVSGGTLVVGANTVGYLAGEIQGALTINNGGTVSADVFWNLGFGAGCVSTIAINGGVLNFTDAEHLGGGYAGSTITMTGGTISGATPDWYGGITNTPTLTTNPSTATAVISSGINLRVSDAGSLTFNVSQGTTASGVDLLISGPITCNGETGWYNPVIKSGAGMLSLAGTNTYLGTTTVNAGTLRVSSTAALRHTTTTATRTSSSTRAPRCSLPPAEPDGLARTSTTSPTAASSPVRRSQSTRPAGARRFPEPSTEARAWPCRATTP